MELIQPGPGEIRSDRVLCRSASPTTPLPQRHPPRGPPTNVLAVQQTCRRGHPTSVAFGSRKWGATTTGTRHTDRQRYPLVETKLQNLVTTEQVQALHEGQIQVGILHPSILDASLKLEIICREPLVVVLPANHALAEQENIGLAQLREETFVMYPGSGIRASLTRSSASASRRVFP